MSDELKKKIAAILCSACDSRAKLITEPCAACTFSGIHHHYLDTDGNIAFALPCTASKADEILALLAPAIAEALESAACTVEHHARGYPINLCNLVSVGLPPQRSMTPEESANLAAYRKTKFKRVAAQDDGLRDLLEEARERMLRQGWAVSVSAGTREFYEKVCAALASEKAAPEDSK